MELFYPHWQIQSVTPWGVTGSQAEYVWNVTIIILPSRHDWWAATLCHSAFCSFSLSISIRFSQMGPDTSGFYRIMTAANAKKKHIDWGMWMPPGYLNAFSFSSQPLLLYDLFWYYNLRLSFVYLQLHCLSLLYFCPSVLQQNKPFTLSNNDNPILCNDQQPTESQTV